MRNRVCGLPPVPRATLLYLSVQARCVFGVGALDLGPVGVAHRTPR